jgi:hypothetical protein
VLFVSKGSWTVETPSDRSILSAGRKFKKVSFPGISAAEFVVGADLERLDIEEDGVFALTVVNGAVMRGRAVIGATGTRPARRRCTSRRTPTR